MILLSELWAGRWSWAAAAVDDVRGQLDPELRHLVGGRADVPVVLYGPTQVGKTTLLLRLLGVAEQHRKEVSQTLQAGRTSGQSSTSVPLRYRWSPFAEEWELAAAGESERCSGRQLIARLRSLRESLSDRRDAPAQPLTVGLPYRYRSAKPGPVMPHVLDLPGIGPDDPDEQAVVPQFVQRYVPLADLVVIVVASTQMGPLVKALSSPELDWLSWPKRFRIVLTYTATEGYNNDRRFQERTDAISKDEIREAVCEQLAFSLPELQSVPERRRLKDMLYPIEYGDSWETKATKRQRATFGPVFAELLQELGKQIGLTAVDDGRYLALPRAAEAVRTHYDRRRKEITTRIDAHRESRCKAEKNVKRLKEALAVTEKSRAEAKRLQELAAAAAAEASGITVHLPAPTDPEDRSQCQLEEQREALRRMVRASADAWREGCATAALSAAARHALPIALMKDSEADQILANHHGNDHFFRDRWMPRRCYARLASRWPQMTEQLQDTIRGAAQRWVEEARERLPRAAAAQQVHQAALNQVKRADGELKAVDRALVDLTNELANCDKDAAESEAITTTILNEIDDQWRRHVDDLYCRIAAAADPDDAGRLALAVLLAHHCRDRMRND